MGPLSEESRALGTAKKEKAFFENDITSVSLGYIWVAYYVLRVPENKQD